MPEERDPLLALGGTLVNDADIGAQMDILSKPTKPFTTPGQVLAEENRPFQRGMEAAGKELTPDPVTGMPGALSAPKLISAGFSGAGEAVGTAAHNILSNIPYLGGPSGVVPAGGAALANAATQVLGVPSTIGKIAQGTGATRRGIGTALQTPIREKIIRSAPEEFANLPKADFKALETQTAPWEPVQDIVNTGASEIASGPPGIKKSTQDLVNYYRKRFSDTAYNKLGQSPQAADLTVTGQELMKAEQRLMREAEKYSHQGSATYDPNTAKYLKDLRSKLVAQLDGLGGANTKYARTKTMEELMSIGRTSANPGVELRDRFASDKYLTGLFSPEQQQQMVTWFDKMGAVSPGATRGKQIAAAVQRFGPWLAIGGLGAYGAHRYSGGGHGGF